FAFEAKNAVDHQERITMRQKRHDAVDVEAAFARRESLRLEDWRGARKFPRERADQLGVRAMAWFYRDDVAANARPEKRQVADDIDDFVPDEFVGEPQRFLAQDRFAA